MRKGPASPVQNRTAVYIDDFSSHEVGQVGGEEQNGAGDFFRGGRASERDDRSSHFLAGLGFQNGIGHVGGDPTGSNAIYEDVATRKLRRKAFDKADDAAFRSAIMRMEGFTTLAFRRSAG